MSGEASARGPARGRRALAWLLLAGFFVAPPGLPAASAAPWGWRVVSGQVDIDRDGRLTTITASDGAIIDYGLFLIFPGETVRFEQPYAFARVLNRVDPIYPAIVNGHLEANGIVYILNPSGVFFGDQALVDVGGLVAAAGTMSDDDFRNGVDRFTRLHGSVENRGEIQAHSVSLVGRSVANHGSIVSDGGMIAMVAGGEVMLSRLDGHLVVRVDPPRNDPGDFAIQQTGLLDAGDGQVSLAAGDAYSLAMNHDGVTRARSIHLEGGEEGVVAVSGTLDASNAAEGERGGTILVLGDRIALQGADLDASGDAGGGHIRVGGDVQGTGPLRTARRTYVDGASRLRADALREGDGGTVVVWSDEKTAFHGDVSARGGPQGGDGGFAEISGAIVLESRGGVDLGAPLGDSGTVLYDPRDIEIRGGTADGTDLADPEAATPELELVADDGTLGSVLFDDLGDGDEPFVIYESEIEGTDADIVLEATRSVLAEGEFDGNAVVLLPGNSLVISTSGEIDDDGEEHARGIDLTPVVNGVENRTLGWVVSEGGVIQLTTNFDTRGADIDAGILVAVGRAQFQGDPNSVRLVTSTGSVVVDTISTSGINPETGGAGGSVFIRSSDGGAMQVDESVTGDLIIADGIYANGIATPDGTSAPTAGAVGIDVTGGDVAIGTIQSSGAQSVGDVEAGSGSAAIQIAVFEGDATIGSIVGNGGDTSEAAPGDAGDGARVDIQVTGGDLTVGTEGSGTPAIDIAGGDAQLDPGDADSSTDGGFGGTASLLAKRLGPDDPESVRLTLLGDVIATGGDATGVAEPDPDPDAPTPAVSVGGFGGAIVLTSEGDLVVGSAANPVLLDSSAGDGDGNGGSTNGAVEVIGETVDPVSLRATGPDGDVEVYATIRHRGGDTPNGVAGSGGPVTISSAAGDVRGATTSIDSGAGDGVVAFPRSLGFGGDVSVEAGGSVAIGDIAARGGTSETLGGEGGEVTVQAGSGDVTVAEVDVAGGTVPGADVPVLDADGNPELDPDTMDPITQFEGIAGDAGSISIATGTEEGVGGGVTLTGLLSALGGVVTRDPRPEEAVDGADGAVTIDAVGAVEKSGAPSPQIVAKDVSITGSDIGSEGAIEVTGTEGGDDTLAITGNGDVAVDMQGDAFETVTVTQRAYMGDADVSYEGTPLLDVDGLTLASLPVLNQLATRGVSELDGTRFEYAMRAPGVPLMIRRGAVDLGPGGGAILNSGPLGALAAGSGEPHIATLGDLALEGTEIGTDTLPDAAPLEVDGAPEASLAVRAAGDVVLDLSPGAPDGTFAAVGLTQADPAAGIRIFDAEGDDPAILIEAGGSAEAPESRIVEADTTLLGSDLAYRLEPAAEEPEEGEEPAPEVAVVIESMQLGGAALVSGPGDVQVGDGAGVAIASNGQDVALVADADADGSGAILDGGDGGPVIDLTPDAPAQQAAAASAAVEVAELALLSGSGVGSAAAPIRIAGDARVAGTGGSGGFHLTNQGSEELRIGRVEIPDGARSEPLVASSLSADGDIEIAKDVVGGTGRIVFDRADAGPHAESGGDQVYGLDVLLENPRVDEQFSLDENDELITIRDFSNRVELVAGGDVDFHGKVDVSENSISEFENDDGEIESTGFLPGSLDVSTGGVTRFRDDVGTGGELARLENLATDAVVLPEEGGPQPDIRFAVHDARFRGAVNGPRGLSVDADGKLVFGANVGRATALRGLEVMSDLTEFEGIGVYTGAGGISFGRDAAGTGTPWRAEIPAVATVAKRAGPLTFQTTGTFETGSHEKLTVVGTLDIRAAKVRVGDVAALELAVESPSITVLGRQPGPVLANGVLLIRDGGTDIVANEMAFTSVPRWDGRGTLPTLVVGNGAVSAPGLLSGLPVRRFDPTVRSIEPADLVAADGAVLDVTGTGPPIVADPTREIPREDPTVNPMLQARFSDDGPGPIARVSEGDVLAYLRCAELEGELPPAQPCLPDVAAGLAPLETPDHTAIATDRARALATGYRRLIASRDAQARLRATFLVTGRGYRDVAGGGPVDGGSFVRFLQESPPYREALGYVNELAALLAQVELMGLDAASTRSVQRAMAEDFAAAANLPGLDADALFDAVHATGIGVPPQLASQPRPRSGS